MPFVTIVGKEVPVPYFVEEWTRENLLFIPCGDEDEERRLARDNPHLTFQFAGGLGTVMHYLPGRCQPSHPLSHAEVGRRLVYPSLSSRAPGDDAALPKLEFEPSPESTVGRSTVAELVRCISFFEQLASLYSGRAKECTRIAAYIDKNLENGVLGAKTPEATTKAELFELGEAIRDCERRAAEESGE